MIGKVIKLGRTNWRIVSGFKSVNNEKLWVGERLVEYQGCSLTKHCIICQENGIWYKHV